MKCFSRFLSRQRISKNTANDINSDEGGMNRSYGVDAKAVFDIDTNAMIMLKETKLLEYYF